MDREAWRFVLMFLSFNLLIALIAWGVLMLGKWVTGPPPAPVVPPPAEITSSPRTPSWIEICMAYGYDRHDCEHMPQPHRPD